MVDSAERSALHPPEYLTEHFEVTTGACRSRMRMVASDGHDHGLT